MGGARTGAAAAAIAALAACVTAPQPTPPHVDTKNFSFTVMDVRDSALNARDLDTAAGAYAPNAEVVDAETGLVLFRGRGEIRSAHARFLAACPGARLEILDRAYAEQGRIVADLERVRCRDGQPVESRVRYGIDRGTIVRVLEHGSPLFPGIPGLAP